MEWHDHWYINSNLWIIITDYLNFTRCSMETRKCDNEKTCRNTKSARSLMHVTYPKVSFLLPSVDLDDHQRPPNTLMMYGDKSYAGTLTLVHQNSSLKEMHQDHIGNVSIKCTELRPKKELKIPSRHAASKILLTPRMRKKRP